MDCNCNRGCMADELNFLQEIKSMVRDPETPDELLALSILVNRIEDYEIRLEESECYCEEV